MDCAEKEMVAGAVEVAEAAVREADLLMAAAAKTGSEAARWVH